MNKEEIEELFFPKEFGKKLELNAYDYYKALLDIKEYIEMHKASLPIITLNEIPREIINSDEVVKAKEILDIVNKALGDKEND